MRKSQPLAEMRQYLLRNMVAAITGFIVTAAMSAAPVRATPESPAEDVGTAAVWCDWVGSYAGAWVPVHESPLTVNCEMGRGAFGAAVKQLQTSLNRCYGKGLGVDSDFGPATERALKEVQRAAGAVADGRYGPETRRKMRHEPVSGGNCVQVP